MSVFSTRVTSPARGGAFEVHIAAKERIFLRFFTVLLLIFLSSAGPPAIIRLLSGKAAGEITRIAVWIGGWLYIEAFLGYLLLWNLLGKEIIRADGERLTIKYDIFGLGRVKSFNIREISGIRSTLSTEPPPLTSFLGASGGAVAFDYKGETRRFGIGLNEDEAGWIIKELMPIQKSKGRPL